MSTAEQPRGFEVVRIQEAGDIKLPAGELNTTQDPGAIGFGRARQSLNCRTDRGVFEIDQRYRTWNKALDVANTARDIRYWRTWDGEVRLVAIGNDATEAFAYHQNGTNVATQVGTTDSYVKIPETPIEDDDAGTVTWDHEGRLFIAGGPLGYVYYVEKGDEEDQGSSSYETHRLYRDYDLELGGEAQPERPEYQDLNWADSSSLSASTNNGGSIVEQPRATGKSILWKYDTDGSTSVASKHSLVITQAVDLTDVDAFYLELRTDGYEDKGPAEARRGISVTFDDGANTKTIKYSEGDDNILIQQERASNGTTDRYFVDLLDVHDSAVDTSAITVITITINWNNHSTSRIMTAVLQPALLGGRFLVKDDATWKLINGSPARKIQYAYRYVHNSGSPVTNWTHLEVAGPIAIGARPIASFPHMGTWMNISPIIQNTGTYDEFEVARRASDGSWYDISGQFTAGTLVNTDTPGGADQNFLIDKWTDVEVIANGTTPTTDPDTAEDPFDPADSGPVVDVENGFSWKGSNVYLTSTGQVQFSGTNDFKFVLWDNVDVEPLLQGSGVNPRVVQVTSKADPFLGGVGTDAAYCFTRNAPYVFVGAIPAFADGPWLLDAKGAVGKRAMTTYRGGALYAADDGLYFLLVPPNFANASEVPPPLEMTRNVRDSWEDLFDEGGTDYRDQTVVVAHKSHIWVFCRNKYLHMHPDGRWVTGAWADSFSVVSATSDEQKGIVLIGSDMKTGVIGDFVTDGGTAVAGTGGTAAEWTYRSGVLHQALSWEQWELDIETTAASPNVRMKLTTDRGAQSNHSFTDLTNLTRPVDRVSNSVHNKGRWADLTIVGQAEDKLRSAVMQVVPTGKYRAG